MADAILALNAGSSSIKFALYRITGHAALAPVCRGEVEDGKGRGGFSAEDVAGHRIAEEDWRDDGDKTGRLLAWIEAHLGEDRLAAVGHRVVHGGLDFTDPQRLTPETIGRIEALTPLAPLHQPRSIAPAKALAAERPALAQFACFDTAFHRTIAPPASRYAIPRRLEAEGLRRFGFHGLSYTYLAGRLPEVMPGCRKVVAAHLGSGASLCALEDGRSVDTTMGFSALDGLMMGTRCGALDPGVVLYLMKEKGLSAEEVETLLYRESGLLGVSGISADVRELQASAEPAARDALELFVFRISREIAAMAATLRGLDGIVFSGGIGQHAATIRARVCERLDWLGVSLDPERNAPACTAAVRIEASGGRVAVAAIPSDEEWVIAHQVLTHLQAESM